MCRLYGQLSLATRNGKIALRREGFDPRESA